MVVDILALSIVFNHLPDYLDYQIGDGNPSVFYASSNYVLPSMAVLGIMVKDIVGIVWVRVVWFIKMVYLKAEIYGIIENINRTIYFYPDV